MLSFVKQVYTNLELISMYTYISLCGRIKIDRLQAGIRGEGRSELIPIITFQNMVQIGPILPTIIKTDCLVNMMIINFCR